MHAIFDPLLVVIMLLNLSPKELGEVRTSLRASIGESGAPAMASMARRVLGESISNLRGTLS